MVGLWLVYVYGIAYILVYSWLMVGNSTKQKLISPQVVRDEPSFSLVEIKQVELPKLSLSM